MQIAAAEDLLEDLQDEVAALHDAVKENQLASSSRTHGAITTTVNRLKRRIKDIEDITREAKRFFDAAQSDDLAQARARWENVMKGFATVIDDIEEGADDERDARGPKGAGSMASSALDAPFTVVEKEFKRLELYRHGISSDDVQAPTQSARLVSHQPLAQSKKAPKSGKRPTSVKRGLLDDEKGHSDSTDAELTPAEWIPGDDTSEESDSRSELLEASVYPESIMRLCC